MLLDTIRSMFKSKPEVDADAHVGAQAPSSADARGTRAAAHDPVALAACVLLLEIAHADGEFSDAERQQLESVMERQFALPAERVRLLMQQAEAERQQSVDHFSFTRQIKNEFDLAQKMTLAESMWGLVLADGKIDEHEHYLTRKISNLLDLEPGHLSAAKEAAARARTTE